MEEIAASMAAAGLPAGFHEAAAEIFDRTAGADNVPRAGSGNGAGRDRSGKSDISSSPFDTVMSALM
jgi:hypothetical protein